MAQDVDLNLAAFAAERTESEIFSKGSHRNVIAGIN
jgi:hypothetical protein